MKVLIIEDELNIVDVVKKYLINEKFDVISSYNGADGLRTFLSDKPDFVILDVMLPDIDGFSICQEIRKVSQVPIIFLTAKRHITDKLIGLKIGADDYISKPFSPRELIARMHVILRRYQYNNQVGNNHIEIVHSGLWHDSKSRCFYLDGSPIGLTKSEYNILLFLYTNPRKIFTRNELLDKISGDHYSLDRCIDVHIRNIRKKLKNQDYIKTVFGIGYKYLGENK